jgi:hypothetical protein
MSIPYDNLSFAVSAKKTGLLHLRQPGFLSSH